MVEVDAAEVKQTGNEYFPDAATAYRVAAFNVNMGQKDYAAKGFLGCGFLEVWAMYNAQIGTYLSASANNLEDCGEALVEAANDYDWTDKDNKHKFEKATEGSFEEAVEDRQKERDKGMP